MREALIVVITDDMGMIPYLTDFDLAYHETNRTITTNIGVGGVINYAAPEQLYTPNTGAARAETADIFSLAQLLFFVIVGRDPAGDNFGRNIELLRKALNAWVEGRAADELLALYTGSTQRVPAERPQTVVDFVQPLAKAQAYIQAATGSDSVAEEDFCARFGHLYAGVGKYQSTAAVMTTHSLSGGIAITVRNKGVAAKSYSQIDVEVELSITGVIPVSFFGTGASARATINARLDKMLSRCHKVSRHPGKAGSYQAYLEVRDVPLSLDGLARLQYIVSTAVAGIEQW